MRCNQQYLWALIVTGSMFLSGCAAVSKGRADLDLGMKERGIASWYGADFHGWVTANGELYDMQAFTAAHRTLPLGTVARITNVVNGKHVMIRINDRGPYVNGRILDLSYAAANALTWWKMASLRFKWKRRWARADSAPKWTNANNERLER